MAIDPIKIAIRGSTQEHLPIEDIVDGVVILKDGSCAAVLQISSVNFDLLSEREQGALVFAYGGILNSLNFPVQIVIYSSTKDVSVYVNNLKKVEEGQSNPLLKERISFYRKFIEETVKKNDVLSKSFYLVIPYSILELGVKGMSSQMMGGLPKFGVKTPKTLPFSKDYILEKAKASLEPKKDHLSRLFSRLGLEIRSLNTKELVELFYRIYNEETAANQKIQGLNYDSPMVTTKDTGLKTK
jgi:superfamily I DNA and/or RNA helicase